MAKIKIMTDDAADISASLEKELDIGIIPFFVTLGDKTYTSRVDFDNEQFYKLMEESSDIPKTAQITPFRFEEIYLKEADAGTCDLFVVLINSEGSATYANSLLARDSFFENHPEYKGSFRIHCFDGIGYNGLYGEPVVQAARMAKAGASPSEIENYLTDILPRRQIYFGIYDLKYAARSGRIPTAAAFLGNKLGLKPVMKIYDHQITTAAKCRGEQKLIEKVAELSVNDMEEGTPYELIYGNDESCLIELRAAMENILGYGADNVYRIGAAVAANSGPKVAGVAFIRKSQI